MATSDLPASTCTSGVLFSVRMAIGGIGNGFVLFACLFPVAVAVAGSQCDGLIGGGAKIHRKVPDRSIREIAFDIKARYPHDTGAFTEGLTYFGGALYESTGLYGDSDLRRLDLKSGHVERVIPLPAQLFGEGLVEADGELVQLTWKAGMALVYDLDLHRTGGFSYVGQGWGLARLGRRFVLSDGSSQLRFVARDGREVGTLRVTAAGEDVTGLNELEAVDGILYANVYPTDCLARIDPATGIVDGWVDVSSLLPWSERSDGSALANGIAHDPMTGDLFVTGKRWPYLFRIRLLEKQYQRRDKHAYEERTP